MTSKLIRSKDVVWEVLDDQALLVDTATGERWSLNAAAANVWKHCDGGYSAAEISRGFERACDDVAAFCDDLIARGLLRLAPAAAAGGTTVVSMSACSGSPALKSLGFGSNPRRKVGPRGNSGPG